MQLFCQEAMLLKKGGGDANTRTTRGQWVQHNLALLLQSKDATGGVDNQINDTNISPEIKMNEQRFKPFRENGPCYIKGRVQWYV